MWQYRLSPGAAGGRRIGLQGAYRGTTRKGKAEARKTQGSGGTSEPSYPSLKPWQLPAGGALSLCSLGRRDTEVLGGLGDPAALFLDGGVELSRPAHIENLTRLGQAFPDDRIGLRHGANVGSDALAQAHRHPARSEKPVEPVERKIGGAGFRHGRNLRKRRRARAVRYRKNLDLAGLNL